MRYRLCKSWLLLTLFPYLCFALIGLVPHTHGHPQATTPLCAQSGTSSFGHLGALPVDDDDDADHCSLCQVQANIAACAPLDFPPLLFLAQQIIGFAPCTQLAPRAIAIHPSHAPLPSPSQSLPLSRPMMVTVFHCEVKERVTA